MEVGMGLAGVDSADTVSDEAGADAAGGADAAATDMDMDIDMDIDIDILMAAAAILMGMAIPDIMAIKRHPRTAFRWLKLASGPCKMWWSCPC